MSEAGGARPGDVPTRPTVPVLEGEGIGPEVVKAARRVVEAAAAKAYGSSRKLEWLAVPQGRAGEPLPEATVGAVQRHRMLLRGPLESPSERLRPLASGLDLHLARLHFPAFSLRILCEASEGAARASELVGGSPAAQETLAFLKKELPRLSTAIRFGTRERLESYLRSIGRREPALVETGLSFELTSREGSERFVDAALAEAKKLGRRKVTLVVDPSVSPRASAAFCDAAYRVASERHPGTYTWLDHARASTRFGAAVADAARTEALAEGLYVERRTLAELLEDAWHRPETLDFVVSPWSEGLTLAQVLSARSGPAAIARENPGTGALVAETLHGTARALAGKDRANPAGAIRAGVLLLEHHLGWHEAAALVEKGLAQVAAAGLRTEDVAGPAKPPPLGCAAFAEAVTEAISR